MKVSGNAGDTFVLAGWAKGDSAPLTSGTNREFGIIATCYNASGTAVGTATARFNPDTNSASAWQYTAASLEATGAYTSVKIELAYDYNVNTVYFDGIQLYRERFADNYTYNANGNVEKVEDLQGNTTKYTYENNNLMQVIQNDNLKLSYDYDAWHNVTEATSATGLV